MAPATIFHDSRTTADTAPLTANVLLTRRFQRLLVLPRRDCAVLGTWMELRHVSAGPCPAIRLRRAAELAVLRPKCSLHWQVFRPTGKPRSCLVYDVRKPTPGRERSSVRSVAKTEGAGHSSAGTGRSDVGAVQTLHVASVSVVRRPPPATGGSRGRQSQCMGGLNSSCCEGVFCRYTPPLRFGPLTHRDTPPEVRKNLF
jgi:hypothetical protein